MDVLDYQYEETYMPLEVPEATEDDMREALWTRISVDEYPEWVQPTGTHDAYAHGDKVSHSDKHWTSDVDSNVWEPGVYGWTII